MMCGVPHWTRKFSIPGGRLLAHRKGGQDVLGDVVVVLAVFLPGLHNEFQGGLRLSITRRVRYRVFLEAWRYPDRDASVEVD